MRYIKTKLNGIYEVEKITDYGAISKNRWIILHENILNSADTIEELCDKFILSRIDIIILNKEHTKYRFEGSDEWFDITETELKRGIYGAVWTDIGLLYAAKMNKKGELKLL